MTFEQTKNTKALSITIAVHALLLIFFLLFRYTMPAQEPIVEMGMEVNLGTSEDGYGSDQPEDMEDPAAMAIPISIASQTEIEDINKEVHTTEADNAPKILINNKKEKKKIIPNTTEKKVVAKEAAKPQVAKYQYAGSDGKGGNSASQNKAGGNEGIGTGDGDMGVPGGTPGASNYKGINVRSSCINRTVTSYPGEDATYKNGGNVTFRVVINRNGDIIKYSHTFSANSEIKAIAEKRISKVKFNSDPKGKIEDFCDVTFSFTVR